MFFDLPVATAKDRKEYRLFRKQLIKEGFLMMQESVYSKLVVNDQAASLAIERMRKHKPPSGLVQILKVTERQYATMVWIVGEKSESDTIDTFDELIVL